MENIIPVRIQIIAIVVSFSFLLYVGALIFKGKLREEYSIVWIICTLFLVIFSIWRDGLDIIARALGVYQAPNLIFAGALFAVFSYLLHLSVMLSKLYEKNKILAQELALLKEKVDSGEKREKQQQQDDKSNQDS